MDDEAVRRVTARKPIVKVGAVTAPVVRTGGQLVTGAFLIEGVELFIHDFPEAEQAWLTVVASLVLCWVQNALEKRQGRKLVGA